MSMESDEADIFSDPVMEDAGRRGVRRLYRVMRIDHEGQPRTGRKSSVLGVRIGPPSRAIDIRVIDGYVEPNTGGLAVIPDDPMKIAEEFRPPDLGGSGDDPVWFLPIEEVSEPLRYRPDPRCPEDHGYIEPAERMKLERYEQALIATKTAWRLYLAE
jgi:hypothetical protein